MAGHDGIDPEEHDHVTEYLTHAVQHYGLIALALAIAIEAAGIPVPAETALLVLTAYAAHTGAYAAWAIFVVAAVAAIVGDNLGYAVGRFGGWPLLRRYKRVVHLRDEHLKVARLMFAEHGGPVVAGGRFVSVLRTTAAFLAGVNKMPWGRFLVFNALGAVAWAAVWTVIGTVLGAQVAASEGIVKYALVGAGLLVVVGFLVWMRRRWSGLVERAEVAYPGPL